VSIGVESSVQYLLTTHKLKNTDSLSQDIFIVTNAIYQEQPKLASGLINAFYGW